ncbi:MAG: X2-like carbohydrate binding domain-containing protein [Holdemanella sp.]
MIKRCMSVGLALSMLLSLTPITAIHADETQELDVQDTEERKEDLELVPSVSVAGLKAVATEKESITITFKNVGQQVNNNNENNSFWGEIYFTDSAGKPIPNLDFELHCDDVTTQFVKSDANGKYTFKYVYSKPMYTYRNPVKVYAIVQENDKYVHSYGVQKYQNPIKWFNFTTHQDEKYNTLISYPFSVRGGEIVEEKEVLKTYEDGTIVFDAWYDDEACTIKHDFTKPIVSNVDVYAKWKKIDKPVAPPEPEVEKYQITYSAGEGKGPNAVMKIPKSDADYKVHDFEYSPIGKTCSPPSDKYYFKEWLIKFADGTEKRAMPGTKIKITQDTAFIAQWARLYEVKVADTITNGTVVLENIDGEKGQVVTAKEGEPIFATLTANKGYYNKNIIIQQANGIYLPWERDEFDPYFVTFKVENDDITFNADFASLTADPEKPILKARNLKYNGKEQEVKVLGYDSVMMKIEGNKAKDAGTYTVKVTSKTGKWDDGSTDAVTTKWEIETVQRPAPTGLKGFDTSYPGANDGRITGVTEDMKYIEATETKVHFCTGTEITGLKPGLYKVSYKEDKNHHYNIPAEIRINEGTGPVPSHTHTYGAWVSDDTNHWHECTDASCSSIKDKAVHVYDNDMDDTCNVCGYKRVLPTPVVTYKFIEGANGSWTKNSGKNLGFKVNGKISRFTGVKVDGTLIGNDKYTAVSGSTVVTLKKDYLETLSVGKHTLSVVYTDGECTTEFEVIADTKPTTPEEDKKPGTESEKPKPDVEKPTLPEKDKKPSTETKKPTTSRIDKKDVKSEKKKSLNTAYSYNMGQWTALLLMSGFVLVLTVFKKKRN